MNGLGRTLRFKNGHAGNGHNGKAHRRRGHALVTGGAGFIGANLADRLLSAGQRVLIYDNLSRPGVADNLAWLREVHGSRLHFVGGDVRDRSSLRQAVQGANQVFHFAAQVAVTTSLKAPMHDFAVNVEGTLNLLEELRALDEPPPLVFTSTNKVYGALGELPVRRGPLRYEFADDDLKFGVCESTRLDFHSPYGCSKGAADQYVLDYAKSYGLPNVVFRMSCIYGPHQFGTEDQGWIAHFLISAIEDRPIVIYGDGRQARDILYVDDLVDAFLLAHKHIGAVAGQAFNIGGGPDNVISLLELLDLIGRFHGVAPSVHRAGWRVGDQRCYVSDTRKFAAATGWSAHVGARQGIERLYDWLRQARITSPVALQKVLA